MDTDSLYMALSGETLDQLVKPDLKESYYREKRNWIPTAVCDDHLDPFREDKNGGVFGNGLSSLVVRGVTYTIRELRVFLNPSGRVTEFLVSTPRLTFATIKTR